MTQNIETIKKSKQNTENTSKDMATRKIPILSRLKPKNMKSFIRIAPAMLVIVAFAGAIPLPYAFTKDVPVPFTTDEQRTQDLELGESNVIQEGHDGSTTITVSSAQSLWGRFFGWQPMHQKDVATQITKKPVNKVIVSGTKKYQYMLCSGGSYRYYTDEQFQDENTGFTSKSNDYCKANDQGEMVRLSDTAPVSEAASAERSPSVAVRDGCTYTSIPYNTVYRDVTWLNKGETSVYKGRDGTESSCGWSTAPTDEVILRGTSEAGSGSNPERETNNQDSVAYGRCVSAYNSAISQIQSSASQGMSGQDALKRQVESEFSRCKRAAGF